MRYLGLLAVVALFSSCSLWPWHKDAGPQVATLQNGKSILIATPNDGVFENRKYPLSGKQTALVVRSAFEHHSNNVAVSAECRDLNCLQAAHSMPVDYYVVPEILHWEDLNSEWYGDRYKLEIKLSLYDANDGRNLATKILSQKSAWFKINDDYAQNLLAKPVDNYVKSLF